MVTWSVGTGRCGCWVVSDGGEEHGVGVVAGAGECEQVPGTSVPDGGAGDETDPTEQDVRSRLSGVVVLAELLTGERMDLAGQGSVSGAPPCDELRRRVAPARCPSPPSPATARDPGM